MLTIVKTLKSLIELDTIAVHQASKFDYIKGLLELKGFQVDIVKSRNCYNLIAFNNVPNAKLPYTLFVGHLDVVPGMENIFRIEDGYIYGRGAADMKGAIAAFLDACDYFNSDIPVGIVITGDEETTSTGAEDIVNNKLIDQEIGFIISGEPTAIDIVGDNVKVARRCNLNIEINARGDELHTGYAGPEANIAYVGLKKLLRMVEKYQCHIISVDVENEVYNVTPNNFNAVVNIRSEERVQDVVNDFHEEFGKDHIKIITQSEGFHSSISKEQLNTALENIKQTTSAAPSVINNGGISDMQFFHTLGPFIEIGLLSSTIHSENEHVHESDLLQLSKIYVNFVNNIKNII